MSPHFTEEQMKQAAMEWFEAPGHEKLFGPDIVIFLNGIPRAMFELKGASSEV